MKKIFSRALRGSMFGKKAFEHAYWDDDATADGVILVASVSAVSFLIRAILSGGLGTGAVLGLLGAAVSGVAGWLILAACVWVASTKIFKTGGGLQTMMAAHGLAYLPLILTAVPIPLVGAAAVVWYLAVLVVATRATTDSSLKLAVLSVLVGYAVLVLLSALLSGVTFTAVSAFQTLF
jgi:hypothetical protein